MFEQNIDIEHLFLGLLYESEGVAFQVLKGLKVDLDTTDQTFAHLLSQRDTTPMRLAPRGKRSIELAVREAIRFRHHYLGTEHLLLGIIRLCEEERGGGNLFASLSRKRDDGDRTSSILASLGLSYKRVRQQSAQVLADGVSDDDAYPQIS